MLRLCHIYKEFYYPSLYHYFVLYSGKENKNTLHIFWFSKNIISITDVFHSVPTHPLLDVWTFIQIKLRNDMPEAPLCFKPFYIGNISEKFLSSKLHSTSYSNMLKQKGNFSIYSAALLNSSNQHSEMIDHHIVELWNTQKLTRHVWHAVYVTGVTPYMGLHCGKFSKFFLTAGHYLGHTMTTPDTPTELFNKTGKFQQNSSLSHCVIFNAPPFRLHWILNNNAVKPSLFWDVMQCKLAAGYWCFMTDILS